MRRMPAATADGKEKAQHIHGAAPDNSKARQRVPRNA